MHLSRIGVCLLLTALLTAPGTGQEPSTPTFRTSTRLVQVDVIVRAQDAPVTGLKKEDFQVFDNGKRQEIAVFNVREAAAVRPVPVPLPPGVVSNRPVYRGPEPVTVTVVLMDQQNTYPEDQGYARLQALKYLDKSSRQELISVYAIDTTLHVLQDFTEDRAVLRAAVEKFKMAQSLNMQDGMYGLLSGLKDNAANAARQMNFIRQADITTTAFEQIARSLAGLPGRKKLIWITAGIPLAFTQDNERNLATMTEFTNLSPTLYKPMKLMNDANVAIYPLDPRGVMSYNTPGLNDPGLPTMTQLAAMTGGKAFYNDNDLTIGLDRAFSDTDLTYTLGFYQPEDAVDGATHAISVKVDRSGADVRYRKSYSAEGPAKPLAAKVIDGTLNAWMQAPLESTEIMLQAAAMPTRNRPGYYDVAVSIDAAGLKLTEKDGRFTGSFELGITPDTEKTPKGLRQTVKVNLTQQRLTVALANGITIVNSVRVANDKGKFLSPRLHLVVLDRATAKTGSVRIQLSPPK